MHFFIINVQDIQNIYVRSNKLFSNMYTDRNIEKESLSFTYT